MCSFPKRLVYFSFLFVIQVSAQSSTFSFKDASKSIDHRLKNLLTELTLEEKISLLGYQGKAIPRLQIPAYNWWNEALHGVARAGKSTVFPQAIALAATFNDSLIWAVADVISTEARAKHNLALQQNSHIQYMGLTFWSPNINIFRDPRWGRGQETYGEDPFLTSKMGAAFVRGMQGSDKKFLKTAATAKHFAVHSGPENQRHIFNAIIDEKDLRETYLYAFKNLVDAKVEGIMCAYNRINGKPCCTNESLIKRIARDEWGFKGHFVTDCWALEDIYKGHKVLNNEVEVAAAALKAGINIDCSELLQSNLMKAVKQGLISTVDIDDALKPSLITLFKLGFFDEKPSSPYKKLSNNSVNSLEHQNLSRIVAQQSMVLLKNNAGILPLQIDRYKSIMVIGPNAGTIAPLLGNYHGISGNMVSIVEGITNAVGSGTLVQYEQGCDNMDTTRFSGIWAASLCDLSIAVIGLSPVLEGEEHDAFLSDGGGDKISLELPTAQIKLLKQLKQNGKPVVVIVTAGSNINIAAIEPYADAILLAWYPGEQGGNAVADILLGKVSPSGRLPVTFYNSLSDLPSYDNYSMAGRTYRYFNGIPKYPFGFGLSYTSFQYKWISKPILSEGNISFSIDVMNTGKRNGDEVVQVYIKYPPEERMPIKELKAFKKVTVLSNGNRKIDFKINTIDLKKWDLKNSTWKIYPGEYKIVIASNAADEKLVSTININN